MTDLEQKKAAKEFSIRWKDKGYEKGESQKYWIDLLENVLGVSNAVDFIHFEDTVHIDKRAGFIDGFIDKTKVLIEQKSIDKDLRKAIKQSDGSLLNPFQQAKRYSAELAYDNRPRWIVTCNFKSFLVYDMNNPNGEPEEILLKDLGKEYYRLSFLVDTKNEHLKKEEELSFKAGELVGKLYDAFSKEYRDINNEQSQKDLNELCVRLVFCLYAEDAGLFGRKNIFHDYLAKYDDLTLMRENLIKLFRILDTPLDKRDPYLEDDLNQFPYVNGGLFSNENIEIPKFTEEIKNTLLAKASDEFDWSEISPTIFGAVFESTLNPNTRRSGGMHYTSIENIHKVIDPLFLNELRDKLNEAESYKNEKTRNEKLNEFQNYISSLTFLDPACGSGNFLTETYLSIRRLENEALEVMSHGMMMLDMSGIIKVSIQQFYGIEINDFAVKVAKTALWIAEAQMWNETKKIISTMSNIGDFLPLETYENIVEANALRIDWNNVVPNTKCNYIMGNPPFVGQQLKSKEQSDDMALVFGKGSPETKLDYVLCWYKKAIQYMKNKLIKTAFVSTSSICQGESVPAFWKNFVERDNGEIQFAHTSFEWKSEASDRAMVYCVIVGFSNGHTDTIKYIFSNGQEKRVNFINAYLISAPNIWIVNRSNNNLSGLPKMTKGSEPTDGGNLFLNIYEKNKLEEKYPILKKYIKPFIGGSEFLNNKIGTFTRFCFYFKNGNPADYIRITEISERLKNIKELREKSTADRIKATAKYPYLFCQDRQPNTDYLVFPQHTTSNRKYIPIGFMNKDVIVGNACYTIPNISLYEFGILTSNVHMAWTNVVCGRLGEGYRYSPAIYNNFPWPNSTKEQRKKIEQTAKMILDARNKYSESSLSSLYNELSMPPELIMAHQLNDRAVWEAYGKKWTINIESDCVAKLMEMYQELVVNEK